MMRSGRLLGSACCVLWALGMLSSAGPVLAQAQCESSAFNTGNATVNSQLFEHSFDSGARWSLCVSSDDRSGLSLEQVYYGAPQDEARKVLESASLAQILFKYDEDINAQHWLSEIGLGGSRLTLKEARKKARISRNLALQSYLEAKEIKTKYDLDDIESDEDDHFFTSALQSEESQ